MKKVHHGSMILSLSKEIRNIFIFLHYNLHLYFRGWKRKTLNFSFVCVSNSISTRNFMVVKWLEAPETFWWSVSESVSQSSVNTKISYFLRSIFQNLFYTILLKFGNLYKIDYIITWVYNSALYLKWVLSCRGVKNGSKLFV